MKTGNLNLKVFIAENFYEELIRMRMGIVNRLNAAQITHREKQSEKSPLSVCARYFDKCVIDCPYSEIVSNIVHHEFSLDQQRVQRVAQLVLVSDR